VAYADVLRVRGGFQRFLRAVAACARNCQTFFTSVFFRSFDDFIVFVPI
jgi:uncharacterized protein (DUF934 family)